MILQVDDEIYKLILNTLMECRYDDVIEDIVIYKECEHESEDDENKYDDDNVLPKIEKKKKIKKYAD